MSLAEQQEIATSIQAKMLEIANTNPNPLSPEDTADDAAELAREAWQDRGYFSTEVSSNSKTLTSNALVQRIVVDLDVEAGTQYVLREITFKDNNAIPDSAYLRRLFPIQPGDIFSREKVASGLKNLRDAYFDKGYINFAPIPLPTVDDQNRSVSLAIDIDEGRQFRISSVEFLGIDQPLKDELLEAFPIGAVYKEHAFEQFVDDHPFGFRAENPWFVQQHLDERNGAVALTLDARPCMN